MKTIALSPTLTLYLKEFEPLPRESAREAERGAVREILTEVFGQDVMLSHHTDGAPYLENRDVYISVSHCRGVAGIAVSTASRHIGLDLESNRRGTQLQRVATRFLATDELGYWSHTSERLLEAWTIKEAAFKAAGLSIADLRTIKIKPGEPLVSAGNITLQIISQFYCNSDTLATIVQAEV